MGYIRRSNNRFSGALESLSIQNITGVTVATQHKVGAFCNGTQVVFHSHDESGSNLETRFVLCGM